MMDLYTERDKQKHIVETNWRDTDKYQLQQMNSKLTKPPL